MLETVSMQTRSKEEHVAHPAKRQIWLSCYGGETPQSGTVKSSLS